MFSIITRVDHWSEQEKETLNCNHSPNNDTDLLNDPQQVSFLFTFIAEQMDTSSYMLGNTVLSIAVQQTTPKLSASNNNHFIIIFIFLGSAGRFLLRSLTGYNHIVAGL